MGLQNSEGLVSLDMRVEISLGNKKITSKRERVRIKVYDWDKLVISCVNN